MDAANVLIAMCYRSHLAAVFLASFGFCSIAVPQDSLGLFHKMQHALGGAHRIAAVHDFEECVHANTWDNNGKPHGEVRKRTRWVNPNSLRLDQVGPDDTYVLYFNGESGWEILPDRSVHDLAGDELRFARNYLNGLDLKFWSNNHKADYQFTSAAPNVIAFSANNDPSHRTEITLDPSTFLPIKQEEISLADPLHPIAAQTLQVQGWKAFQGIKFPQHTINFHSGRKLADITAIEVKLDSGIKPADLDVKPPDLKPAMSACGE